MTTKKRDEKQESLSIRFKRQFTEEFILNDWGQEAVISFIYEEIKQAKREAVRGFAENIKAMCRRKRKFYEGAHGEHWEGYFSALDTIEQIEIDEELARMEGDHE